MNRHSFLAAALLVMASVAQAQVIQPNTRAPLTGDRARIHGALVVLRDSLLAVTAAGGRLERDMQTSSDAVLRSRARAIGVACGSSARTTLTAQQAIATSPEPAKDPRQTRVGVLSALKELRGALEKCDADFGEFLKPDHAEQLRGYSVSRSVQTNAAIRRYGTPLHQYLGAIDIVIEPAETESKSSGQ